MLIFLSFLWVFGNFDFASSQRVCGIGKHSRPVNEDNFPILKRNLQFLDQIGFHVFPNVTECHNNGKTVVTKLHYALSYAKITKGPYGNDTYRLEFLYLNWLKESETPKDALPFELHVVFRNRKYRTFEQARRKDFGITVWSFRYNSTFRDKPDSYTDIIFRASSSIREPGTTTLLSKPHNVTAPLHYILKYSKDYYVYQGRLTQVLYPCSGDVIWLEFPRYKQLTRDSYENLKQLKSFNNTRLMDQVLESTAPEGPIYQNIPGYRDYYWSSVDFEYFNATSEDNDDGETNEANTNREVFSSFIIIFGLFMNILGLN